MTENVIRFIIVTFILFLMFLSITTITFFPSTPQENVLEFIRSLKEFLLIIIGFYFGSSSGSLAKSELLAKLKTKEINEE